MNIYYCLAVRVASNPCAEANILNWVSARKHVLTTILCLDLKSFSLQYDAKAFPDDPDIEP